MKTGANNSNWAACGPLRRTHRLRGQWRKVAASLRPGVLGVLALVCVTSSHSASPARDNLASRSVTTAPNVAFYYQPDVPVDELQAFDIVVIDPARASIPAEQLAPRTAWFARLQIPPVVKAADAAAYVASVVKPLWNQGYTGFVLDDGIELGAEAADAGAHMVAIVDVIRRDYPQARLVLRNHLPLAPALAADLFAVVVDSLYVQPRGYGDFLGQVSEQGRATALQQIKRLQRQTGLPVVALDYCPKAQKTCRRDTARRLADDGVLPYVTAPGVGLVGIGRIEVMPRKIALVQSMSPSQDLEQSYGVRVLAMPLHHLGFDIRYIDLNKPLPNDIGNDRYAGVVVAVEQAVANAGAWRQWLLARIRDGLRVAVVNHFGFTIDESTARALGMDAVPVGMATATPVKIMYQAPLMGFEWMPPVDAGRITGVRVGPEGRPLLRLDVSGRTVDAAAFTSWGGYMLAPYGIVPLNTLGQYRWAFQPIAFFKEALAVADMPVPDVTTENGRRLLFVHVGVDGFASKAEFAQARGQYSGDVLYSQIFKHYAIPTTVSFVADNAQAEMHLPDTAELRAIAHRILALPSVVEADDVYNRGATTITKTHNSWANISPYGVPYTQARGNDAVTHTFSLLDGKQPKALFGGRRDDGDLTPHSEALATQGDDFRVYVAAMSEDAYAYDWRGAYSGYERVLETFALTDAPIRFKPLNINFHFYSGTKPSSLKAVHTVFKTALSQPVFPVYTSDYVARVLDWRRVAVAREGDRWLVRSGQKLRQLRWSGKGVPDLATANGVAGYVAGQPDLYIHMGADEASFEMTPGATKRLPYVREAAGFVRDFKREGRNISFSLGGYYKPFVQLAGVAGCAVGVNGATYKSGHADVRRIDVVGRAPKPVSLWTTVEVKCE